MSCRVVSWLGTAGVAARLRVNGRDVSLGSGGATMVSTGEADCSVVVMELAKGTVTLGADCGMA
ncbi:hypothetical protein [Salipiger pallidus]|uniref:hypothetical protein n=1 Tax=Salipiger pallidus TaxID=1775170 RepID=UPI001667EB68|nr:hypothetical protein [Salipiger pallidus]